MIQIKEVLKNLEDRAPSGTAEDWDNVGLLVGDSRLKSAGAVISIDLTEQTLETAVRKGYKLIVNHHPCIFPKSRGLSKLTENSHSSKLVYQAVREGISVIACHTNFDRCSLEVVEQVSKGLGVVPKGRLLEHLGEQFFKLVVFVPHSHSDTVREALSQAGAGVVGNYDSCTFGLKGEGTFRGGQGTRPFLGQPGVLERAEEIRLETILPSGVVRPVVEAMIKAHPYEEVAYDLYPVEQAAGPIGLVKGLGYGFWGDLDQPKTFPDLARHVKNLFKVDGFWVSQPIPKRIRRLGFVAGKGASFIGAASRAGCDLIITGEAGYHSQLEGTRLGVAVMELGHRESEKFFLLTMKNWLSEIGLKTTVLDIATQKIWSGGRKK